MKLTLATEELEAVDKNACRSKYTRDCLGAGVSRVFLGKEESN